MYQTRGTCAPSGCQGSCATTRCVANLPACLPPPQCVWSPNKYGVGASCWYPGPPAFPGDNYYYLYQCTPQLQWAWVGDICRNGKEWKSGYTTPCSAFGPIPCGN